MTFVMNLISLNNITYIINRLNDQFFFILGDISNMTFEIWKSLDLPINLFFILQEKLNQVKNQKNIIPEKTGITGISKENIVPKIEVKKVFDAFYY